MRPPLPLTVIGGYLGAGKTTLINHVLTGDHGKRLMVMVNDFGAVNIDAELLASASDDTLELTNGCVCCTMGADLFMAVGDVLDRAERPDHLIIEASGIANPARIAQVAETEPDLHYAGIITLVDVLHMARLLADTQIAPQVIEQIRVADIVHPTKAPLSDLQRAKLQSMGATLILDDRDAILSLMWDLDATLPEASRAHAHFVKWSHQGNEVMSEDRLAQALAARPPGLYRIKGFVAAPQGQWIVSVVGRVVEIKPSTRSGPTTLVAIGPEGQVTPEKVDAWWASINEYIN